MGSQGGEGARRIAFLSEHASPVALLGGADAGGQNVYVDEVSRHLGRLGYAVDVFTRRDSDEQPPVMAWRPGVRVVHVEAGPARTLPKDDLWALMPAFRDGVARFAAEEGTGYDVIHGNFWMSGWVAADLGQRLGVPVVQIFHAMGKTKQCHQGAADTSPEERIGVEIDVIRAVDRVIAQCPSERDELVGDYGAPPDKVEIIPSAVNTEIFRPLSRAEARRQIEPELGIGPDDEVVSYVGRMLPRKDVRNLVRAFVSLVRDREAAGRPAPKLLLVGGETGAPDPITTPEIAVLQGMAADLGVAHLVCFTGNRQQDVLHRYYGAADVTVTTPWYEPFGLTPLEGMACGRPVVGSAVGGITFTVEDGVTGFLVPPREPEALAARLRELLDRPGLRDRMGRAARARVERCFTWPTVAERTVALYEELWAEASRGGEAKRAAAPADPRALARVR